MDYTQTQQFEGWRPDIYTDTTGNPTTGWGFNLNDAFVSKLIPKEVRQGKRQLTQEEATPIFMALYQRAQKNAQQAIGEQYGALPPDAQAVFTDMSYNMGGPKFSGFQNMIGAARNQDWQGVSREMQDSKWYNQVGDRSKKLQGVIQSLSGQTKVNQTNVEPEEQPHQDFSQAFAQARKAGIKTFEYNGKLYTTEIK